MYTFVLIMLLYVAKNVQINLIHCHRIILNIFALLTCLNMCEVLQTHKHKIQTTIIELVKKMKHNANHRQQVSYLEIDRVN